MEEVNDEIDLFQIARVLLRHKRLICCTVGILVGITIIVALILPPVYEAKAVIMPVKTSDAKEGAMALASQFGLGTPEQSQKAEVMGLLKSSQLRERVLVKHNLLPVLLGPRPLKEKTEEEKLWMGLRFLDKALKVTAKQKENTIEIVMRFKDKKVVADVVNYTLRELTGLMSGEEKRVAEGNRKHLEDTIGQTLDPFVKSNIYNLMAKQIEKYAMAEATENFAFKVLDPPRIPDQRVSPRRTMMVVVSFIIAVIVAVVAAFAKEYWLSNRDELKGLLR